MTFTRAAVTGGALVLSAAAGLFFVTSSRASGREAEPRDIAVACGEFHRAIVRQEGRDSDRRVSVECVPVGVATAQTTFNAGEVAGGMPTSAGPMVIPAVYVPQRVGVTPPQVASVAPVQAPPVRSTSRVAVRKRTTSWQKRAAIVGVSAGAGAGVGALIGGKKGALIGAAAGGGGAAVVDLLRQR